MNTEGRKTIYDKIQLLMMNNQAFKMGLIDGEVRERIERQIWAS